MEEIKDEMIVVELNLKKINEKNDVLLTKFGVLKYPSTEKEMTDLVAFAELVKSWVINTVVENGGD